MSSILLAWSNINQDSMFSNYGVEWTVSDESSVVRFDLSARLDSKGFKCSTHFPLKGPGDFPLDNFAWHINRNDFR